ncbi:MAG: hypothetical protein JWM09_1362 [Francisellaceae bacterium]|nr:hypothetical protein [Francisellaceae bacterium]
MLLKWIKFIWQLCLLKQSPENFPYSPNILFGFNVLFAFLLLIMLGHSAVVKGPILIICIALFLIGYNLYVYLPCRYCKYENRFVQIASSLMAVSLMLIFLRLIISPILVYSNSKELLGMSVIIFEIWLITIKTHIFKTGLELTQYKAFLLSILPYIFILLSSLMMKNLQG